MKWFRRREPETVQVGGEALHCQVCGNDTFWRRRGLLHGAASSLFDLEWVAPTCECLVCSSCGYVHWFYPLK